MPSCFRIAKTEKNHGVCSLVKFSWLIPLFNYSLRQDCAKEEKKRKKKKIRNTCCINNVTNNVKFILLTSLQHKVFK